MRADVKSEQYDIAESPPDSVRLDQVLPTDDDGVVAAAALPWWEEFPKRWVIVLLCFSAFLLCNMDRVINRSLFSRFMSNDCGNFSGKV